MLTNLELAEFSCAIEKIQIVRKKPEKYMDWKWRLLHKNINKSNYYKIPVSEPSQFMYIPETKTID